MRINVQLEKIYKDWFLLYKVGEKLTWQKENAFQDVNHCGCFYKF